HFRCYATVVYRYSFLTSCFMNFVEKQNRFDKKTWLATLDYSSNVASLIAAAVSPSAPIDEAESRAYDALAAQLPEPASAAGVQVTRVELNKNAIAFLVRSPEALDWSRINIQMLQAPLGTKQFAEITARVLRKTDGTGLFIMSPPASPPGSLLPQDEYRLVFTYRRNNRAVDPDSDVLSEAGDSAQEEVSLDIPWV